MKTETIKLRQSTVGDFLKVSREKARLTQLELSRALGYSSPQFVSNWERGVAMPPMVMMPELVRVLGVSPRALLEVVHSYQDGFLQLEKERLEKVFRARFRSAAI